MSIIPARPPRNSKISRDSSGLLISVIRTLSASQNSDDRDREKTKLEKDFKRSDQRLDALIAQHKDDLMRAMQDFNKISTRITSSRERVKSIKEKLMAAKVLLDCKRDELRKLWLESLEHKYVLQLLEEIESLSEVPDRLENFMNKQQYLHATQLLASSVALLEDSLEGVDALKETKEKLIQKKENMHEVLVEQLHQHVYHRSTSDAIQRFKRSGSERRRGAPGDNAIRVRVPPSGDGTTSPDGVQEDCIVADGPHSLSEQELLNLEETGLVGTPAHTQHIIAILIHCLALLGKIPDTIEMIRERSQQELLAIINRTSAFLVEEPVSKGPQTQAAPMRSSAPMVHSPYQIATAPKALLDLLNLIFEQFRLVVANHEYVLLNMRRVTTDMDPSVELYTIDDIWSNVQSALEQLLSRYLDGLSLGVPQPVTASFSDATTNVDIASYFSRKRNPRLKKFALFRFDCSSHAISMNQYMQEKQEQQRDQDNYGNYRGLKELLVCQSDKQNITYMFKPMMNFISEIEGATQSEDGNHSMLYKHLMDCVKSFLAHVNMDLEGVIENATKSLESWKVTSDPESLKMLRVPRPVLQSTLGVDQSLQGLREHAIALPMYADHFMMRACNVLASYKDAAAVAYAAVVKPSPSANSFPAAGAGAGGSNNGGGSFGGPHMGGSDSVPHRRVISATWAKDEDICRFLMSLPNWMNLQQLKENKPSNDLEESPEEVRLRNKKESEILIGNLGGNTLIPQYEILSNISHLRYLAQLQESLEWLSARVTTVIQGLPSIHQNTLSLSSGGSKSQEIPPVQESTVKQLEILAADFQEIADTCLLVLHLEVRVHCFYYLLPLVVEGNNFCTPSDSQEPDAQVMRLIRDLASIEEAMAASLQQRKHRYIFEGLGQLVASILINSAATISRINENGVKKMCRNILAIQQNLTTLTMSREVALDHARQYFELFYRSADEILNLIVEHGAQFQEIEYKIALELIHRSLPSMQRDENVLKQQLKKLQDILSEVAVAI